jgi:cyclophilin family peptidyl-prolyl cis-trans isomerase
MARRQARLIVAAVVLATSATAGVKVSVEAPSSLVLGQSALVRVELRAGEQGDTVPAWMFGPGAFSVAGKPLAKRGSAEVDLAPNQKVVLELDLGPFLNDVKGAGDSSIQLAYGNEKPTEVICMVPVQKGIDFLKMEPAELAKYQVVMETNRGTMTMEFWPDVAPEHVRNFLDLASSGFYDGLTFHRIIPGFMIQGGDPTGTGSGSGPRRIKAEFSKKKHEAGVLSMARSSDPNSASSQFFVMHAAYPSLDGSYSAFGKLVSGLDVVEKIVTSPRGANDKPNQPQTIVKATVVKKAG